MGEDRLSLPKTVRQVNLAHKEGNRPKIGQERRRHVQMEPRSQPRQKPRASTAAMEYIAALEERSAIQDRKIAELENHGRAVSIPPTDTAAASTLLGGIIRSRGSKVNIQLMEIKAAMQKIAETVSSQATLVAALTQQITNNGGGGGGRNGGVGGHTTI